MYNISFLAIGTITRCIDNDFEGDGSVGALHSIVQLKLVDVPEMGYSANDKPYPRGHICVKGPVRFFLKFTHQHVLN